VESDGTTYIRLENGKVEHEKGGPPSNPLPPHQAHCLGKWNVSPADEVGKPIKGKGKAPLLNLNLEVTVDDEIASSVSGELCNTPYLVDSTHDGWWNFAGYWGPYKPNIPSPWKAPTKRPDLEAIMLNTTIVKLMS
jgi:hypothetical protein